MAYKYLIHYETPAGSFRRYNNSKTKNKQCLKSLLKRNDVKVKAVYVNNKKVKINHIFRGQA